MKARFLWVIVLLATACASMPARAASTDDAYIERARKFVQENPRAKKVEQTPLQALVFWRRIKGLENMMVLQRLGVLPDDLLSQLKWRLNSHSELRPIAFMDGDSDVFAVMALVRLHASVAIAHLRGQADKHVYSDVALAVSSIGSPLFDKLAPALAPDEFAKDQAAKAALAGSWGGSK